MVQERCYQPAVRLSVPGQGPGAPPPRCPDAVRRHRRKTTRPVRPAQADPVTSVYQASTTASGTTRCCRGCGSAQSLYLDGVKVRDPHGQAATAHVNLTYNQIGAATAPAPTTWPGWGHRPAVLRGRHGRRRRLPPPAGLRGRHRPLPRGRPAAPTLTKTTLPSGRVALRSSTTPPPTGSRSTPTTTAAPGRSANPPSSAATRICGAPSRFRPGNRPYLYEYDGLAGGCCAPARRWAGTRAPRTCQGSPPPHPPRPHPGLYATRPERPGILHDHPGLLGWSHLHPSSHRGDGGPGVLLRRGRISEQGHQRGRRLGGDDLRRQGAPRIEEELPHPRRVPDDYYTYSTSITDPFDPRGDLAIESRDGRSSGPTDSTYRTSFTYHPQRPVDDADQPRRQRRQPRIHQRSGIRAQRRIPARRASESQHRRPRQDHHERVLQQW